MTPAPPRVLVNGWPGSGKSTLARALGAEQAGQPTSLAGTMRRAASSTTGASAPAMTA